MVSIWATTIKGSRTKEEEATKNKTTCSTKVEISTMLKITEEAITQEASTVMAHRAKNFTMEKEVIKTTTAVVATTRIIIIITITTTTTAR